MNVGKPEEQLEEKQGVVVVSKITSLKIE